MEPKKLANGKWQVRFRDLDKKQRAKSFEKKKDAQDFIIGLKHELKSGTYLDARAGDVALDLFWPVFIALKAGKKRCGRHTLPLGGEERQFLDSSKTHLMLGFFR